MVAAVLLLFTTSAGAQQLDGVVLGPDGEPLTNATVILHAVGMGGGAMAGVDTTGPGGEFQFALDGGESAVYFAAIRHEGQIYVGPTVPGGESVPNYVLEITPSTEIGAVGAALSERTPPPAQRMARPGGGARTSDSGALWLVVLLAAAAAAVFVYTAPRYRRRRTQEAVMEVATIENRLEDPAEALAADERDRLRARRDRLKEQLAPLD